MTIRDLLLDSSQSILRNKSRSSLTILGIVIGIAAVILMLSIGRGAEALILNQVADLGSNQIYIESGSGDTTSGPPSPFIEQVLTLDDLEELRKSEYFEVVSAFLIANSTVEYEGTSFFSDVAGVDEYQLFIFPATVATGRFLETEDVDGYARVAVLGWEIADDLFGDSDPIGQFITLKNSRFRVVGVLNEQGSRFFSNLDKRVYIPVTTAQRDVFGLDYVNYMVGLAKGDVDEAKEEARYILRDSHDINNPEGDLAKDDFIVSTQEDAVQTVNVVGTVLTVLLSSIAAISLIVGGIGIMNIMLVSVTERTREIGLRKAIGAREREIMQQFLTEAVMLTFVGGALGVIFGVAGSFVIAQVAGRYVEGWTYVLPLEAVFLAVIVSTVVGLIFGYYPARRAAKLDPIESLRYE